VYRSTPDNAAGRRLGAGPRRQWVRRHARGRSWLPGGTRRRERSPAAPRRARSVPPRAADRV